MCWSLLNIRLVRLVFYCLSITHIFLAPPLKMFRGGQIIPPSPPLTKCLVARLVHCTLLSCTLAFNVPTCLVSPVLCCALYRTVLYTVPYCPIHWNFMFWPVSSVLYCAVHCTYCPVHCTVLSLTLAFHVPTCLVQCYPVLCCTEHCNVLYCPVHCTVLSCALYCTVLCNVPLSYALYRTVLHTVRYCPVHCIVRYCPVVLYLLAGNPLS